MGNCNFKTEQEKDSHTRKLKIFQPQRLFSPEYARNVCCSFLRVFCVVATKVNGLL